MLTGLTAWTGHQALQAREALLRVATNVERLAEGVRSGDFATAREVLASAQEDAARARDLTAGPHWGAAAHLPGVGDDVDAVRTVSVVADTVAATLDDAVDAGELLEPSRLAPRDGRVPLGPLRQAAPRLASLHEVLETQHGVVAGTDAGGLVAPLGDAVRRLEGQLEEAAGLSGSAATAARLLPPMLGGQAHRTYLVLFQNNAEIRATGGMPGAFAVLRAHRGRLSIERQGTAGDLGRHDRPPLPLTDEEAALYGPKLGTFPSNITFTPHFPRTAELGRAMWAASTGETVDGVLSMDPVALSHLLEATGPVRVDGGPALTADNAVSTLLHDVYVQEPDPELQNAFYAESARAVFEAVTSGRADPTALVQGLSRGVAEGRVYGWSAHRSEQSVLAATALGGAVPSTTESTPYVGFFLNDGTATKLQYYLEHRVDVRSTACNIEGRQTLEVTATLRSLAPADAATLPASIIGPREDGAEFLKVKPGHMRVNAHLYAPVGGWIDAVTLDGEGAPYPEAQHLGHPVSTHSVMLAPGEQRVLRYTLRSGLDQPGEVDLRVTPGARSVGAGEVTSSACNRS